MKTTIVAILIATALTGCERCDCPIKTVFIDGHKQKAVMKDGKPHGYRLIVDSQSLVEPRKPVDWYYEQGKQDAERAKSYNQGWKDATGVNMNVRTTPTHENR